MWTECTFLVGWNTFSKLLREESYLKFWRNDEDGRDFWEFRQEMNNYSQHLPSSMHVFDYPSLFDLVLIAKYHSFNCAIGMNCNNSLQEVSEGKPHRWFVDKIILNVPEIEPFPYRLDRSGDVGVKLKGSMDRSVIEGTRLRLSTSLNQQNYGVVLFFRKILKKLAPSTKCCFVLYL